MEVLYNKEKIVQYSTLGIVINDVAIRYGDSLWPGTNPRPGEGGSYKDQSPLTPMGGRAGCQALPFCGLEWSDEVDICNLFSSLICIISKVLITNAN